MRSRYVPIMGANFGGKATWNDDEATPGAQPGRWRAPRTDIRREERCWVSLKARSGTDSPMGFIQVFADGTAAYWKEEGDQGVRAASLEDADQADQKVWTVTASGSARMASLTATGTATVRGPDDKT